MHFASSPAYECTAMGLEFFKPKLSFNSSKGRENLEGFYGSAQLGGCFSAVKDKKPGCSTKLTKSSALSVTSSPEINWIRKKSMANEFESMHVDALGCHFNNSLSSQRSEICGWFSSLSMCKIQLDRRYGALWQLSRINVLALAYAYLLVHVASMWRAIGMLLRMKACGNETHSEPCMFTATRWWLLLLIQQNVSIAMS